MAMILSLFGLVAQEGSITKPADYFGFEPGSDRNLFTYEQLIKYLQKLDSESGRIYLEEIGSSPMGRPMYIAFISSEENISRLEELKKINRELALNPNLGQKELQDMIRDGKTFQIPSMMQTGKGVGMQIMDECISSLLQEGKITAQSAQKYANNPKIFDNFVKKRN